MKAIFLDRDGTINKDAQGYISCPEDYHLYPFTTEALKIFRSLGYKLILVTNQSGIARGYHTFDDLEKVHQHMNNELAKDGVCLDLILTSPYHPKGIIEPYNIDHISRKPSPGMFFDALHKFPIKASQSYMIGDKAIDIEFGKNCGLTTILVKTGDGLRTWENRTEMKVLPDFVVENILSAAHLLETLSGRP